MNRIIKIGMDVHSTNYTLCAMEPVIGSEDRIFGGIQVAPDYKEVIRFIESLKLKLGLADNYAVSGYDGHHEKVDGPSAGLESDSRTAGNLFRGSDARLTPARRGGQGFPHSYALCFNERR